MARRKRTKEPEVEETAEAEAAPEQPTEDPVYAERITRQLAGIEAIGAGLQAIAAALDRLAARPAQEPLQAAPAAPRKPRAPREQGEHGAPAPAPQTAAQAAAVSLPPTPPPQELAGKPPEPQPEAKPAPAAAPEPTLENAKRAVLALAASAVGAEGAKAVLGKLGLGRVSDIPADAQAAAKYAAVIMACTAAMPEAK